MKAKTRTNQPIEHLEDDVMEIVNKGIVEGKIKLYRHNLSFASESAEQGKLIADNTTPLHVISTRKMPYTLEDLTGLEGMNSGLTRIFNDDGVQFSSLFYEPAHDGLSNVLTSYTGLVDGDVIYSGITDFVDEVEEIAL